MGKVIGSQIKRKMTKEERAQLDIVLQKERLRYETNLKIGGIDESGNYTALHYRWLES